MIDILNPTALLQTVELSRQISFCIHRFDMSCNHIIRPLEDLRQQKLISQVRESIVLSDFSTVVGDLLSCHYEALDNLQQFFDQDHDSAMTTSMLHSNYEVTMRSLSRVVTTSSSVLRSLSALEHHVVREGVKGVDARSRRLLLESEGVALSRLPEEMTMEEIRTS
ncbi:hypothetical protein FB107DRAFT_272456 [Schizophyllum commune]